MSLDILKEQAFLIGVCTVFAAIPILIWFAIFFGKKVKSRATVLAIFLLGCLTAPALLSIQMLWEKAPQFNLAAFIETTIQRQSLMYIALFVLFGAMEEIIKHFALRTVDKRTVLITTIGDAIRYSIVAALGFSFVENIYYLYQFWPQITFGELIGLYIFRSGITTAAHILFSGIFGYYYGIGKFAIDLRTQEELSGQRSRFNILIARVFNLSFSQAYQEEKILKGLFIAIGLHSIYNYLLQYNVIWPATILVFVGYLYLRYLMQRKAGNLVLFSDISNKQKSSLSPKDEKVVIELLGLWFQEKKFTDVIHVCERLLERDPDNNVVKIFMSKAQDKLAGNSVYKKILSTLFRKKLSGQDKNTLSHYLEEKERLKKSSK